MHTGSRLDASIQAMEVYFPSFSFSTKRVAGVNIGVWEGTLQPIQLRDGLLELLDDIHEERRVEIVAGGVRHHRDCPAVHRRQEWFEKLRDPSVTYRVKVEYGGGKSHPRAFPAIVIPPDGPKHLFQDGAICPYAPWEDVWVWYRDTVADYLGHTLVWLIKWTVWCQAAVWIGRELLHDRAYLARTIKRNQQCWCASGMRYKACHLNEDTNRLRG